MAVSELGGIAEIEGWEAPVHKPLPIRLAVGLKNFTRKKPLGAVCGIVVIFFFIIGDVVPESINKITRTAGVSDRPVPYLADQLEQLVPFLYPYAKQDLRARLEGTSGDHLLGTDAATLVTLEGLSLRCRARFGPGAQAPDSWSMDHRSLGGRVVREGRAVRISDTWSRTPAPQVDCDPNARAHVDDDPFFAQLVAQFA